MRGLLGLVVVALLVGVVALPALAADPSGSPTILPVVASPEPTASPAPTKAPKPETSPGAGRAPRTAKDPATAVTVSGTVGTRTTDWTTEYTLTSGGTVVVLDAGPPWFFGDDHPLKPFVGEQVTIVGTQRAGDDEVDVDTVNGTALRAPGKPPWAGGWKVVGKDHPGWSQEKWDRWQAKAAAKAQQRGVDCWPPGHCKDKAAATEAPGGN